MGNLLERLAIMLIDTVMKIVTTCGFLAFLIGAAGLDAPDATIAYCMSIGGLIVFVASYWIYWKDRAEYEEII